MICFLEIKRYQIFILLKGATYVVFVLDLYCIDVSMYLYCTQNQLLCNFHPLIFATRPSIVCIDSGTHDTIRVSLALAIQFFDVSIDCCIPIFEALLAAVCSREVPYFDYQVEIEHSKVDLSNV